LFFPRKNHLSEPIEHTIGMIGFGDTRVRIRCCQERLPAGRLPFVSVPADTRIRAAVIREMREEIRRSRGQEVLFVGRLDEERFVREVEVFARGSAARVAAPAPIFERGEIVIHNHPSGRLLASDADVDVASQLAELGIGSAIVDNEVGEIYVLVEPVTTPRIVPIDEDEVESILSDAGPIARELPGFRRRESQIEMARRVTAALNDEEILLAEAGTGVGKSFAYLVPAIQWARRNEGRIVVATATINLQQQLVERDIPMVQQALGTTVKAALVKGRGNYLCPRRLAEQREESDLFEEGEEYRAIADWAEKTETGSRSELPFYVSDETWSRVNSDTDSCSVSRCPRRDRCFVLRARMAAAGAQIIVANHHLLFSDLQIRRAGLGWEGAAVLPVFSRVVFDEAHNIERAATSFFSESISRHAIRRQTGRILRRRGRRRFGILDRLRGLGADPDALARVESTIGELERVFDTLNATLVAFLVPETTWRRTENTRQDLEVAAGQELEDTRTDLVRCIEALVRVYRGLDDQVLDDPNVGVLVGTIRRLEALSSVLGRFIEEEIDPETVLWIERRGSGRGESWVSLVSTPLDIREIMRETVYESQKTVVMTSATLAVNNSFSFWGGSLGIPFEDERVVSAVHSSPFDYEKRVVLGIPRDAPPPDQDRYTEYLLEFLPRLIGRVGGGALLLFTSYRQLEQVHREIAPVLEGRGISCYRQGGEDRTRLLELFRSDVASVLFATDSFWEGIDAPGSTLRLVVVCRLPFRVPTDPVQKARSEAIEAGGGNSFFDYSLPQAVIRLKQGFGRLMRRTDDYGAVVVTDSRLVYKRYGTVFINSLPETRRIVGSGEEVVDAVWEFLGTLATAKKTASPE